MTSMHTAYSFLVAARKQKAAELEALLNICELVRLSGRLIHALQSERGAANLYVAGQKDRFLQLHCDKTKITDQQIVELLALLEPTSRSHTEFGHRSTLLARIALALLACQSLADVRLKVRRLSSELPEISSRYTEVINSLITLIFEATDLTVDPEVSRLLLALFNLIEAKELSGLERANGSRVMACGVVTPQDRELLSDLIERQEESLRHFEHFCGQPVLVQWQALKSTLPLAELERLRRKLLTTPIDKHAETADEWFTTTTARLDDLHVVESHLTDEVKKSCLALLETTQQILADQGQILSSSLDLPHGILEPQDKIAGNTPHHQHQISWINRALLEQLQAQATDLKRVNNELAAVRAALEDRKLIDRAKGMLMQQQGIAEETAYNLLRQKAMQQNMRMSDVAASLLAMADLMAPLKP